MAAAADDDDDPTAAAAAAVHTAATNQCVFTCDAASYILVLEHVFAGR